MVYFVGGQDGDPPAYSAKQMVRGDLRIFCSKRSFLFKNRMIEVSVNHLLLQIESNSFKLSCIRFCEQKCNGKQINLCRTYGTDILKLKGHYFQNMFHSDKKQTIPLQRKILWYRIVYYKITILL